MTIYTSDETRPARSAYCEMVRDPTARTQTTFDGAGQHIIVSSEAMTCGTR